MKPSSNLQRNNQSGYAMALVLIFMTVILMLGSAMLVMSQASASQSSAVYKSDQHYYAAESAVQLAAQMLVTELLNMGNKIVLDDESIGASGDPEVAALIAEDKINTKLSDIYNGVVNKFNALPNKDDLFNGITLELLPLKITRSNYKPNDETSFLVDYSETITYTMTVKSGGYAIAIDIPCNTYLIVEDEVEAETVFVDVQGDSYYKDYVGGIYGDGEGMPGSEKEKIYNMLMAGLDGIIENTNDLTRISVLDLKQKKDEHGNDMFEINVTTGEKLLDGSGNEIPIYDQDGWSTNLNKKDEVQYAKCDGNVTLSGNYPYLEYLEVGGKLTISDNVYCPNLKGVYVGGGMAVNENATFNKMISEGESITDNRMPNSGRTDFLVTGGDINITCDTEINWGRFFAQGQNINVIFSGNDALTSNSIYVATKNGGDKGKILANSGNNFRPATNGAAPQFYAEGDIKLGIQNSNTSFVGVFMTKSDEEIFTAKTALNPGNMVGLYVGNCGTGSSTNQSTVVPFSSENSDLLMEGGIFDVLVDELSSEIVTDITIKTVLTIEGYDNISIRDTTGENK